MGLGGVVGAAGSALGSLGSVAGPVLRKGALVQFSTPHLAPVPSVILFQYNPESLTRSLTPYDPRSTAPAGPNDAAGAEKAALPQPPDSQAFDPTETCTLNLLLDASDALEVPELFPTVLVSGVADRLAALEMLLYPAEGTETLQSSVTQSLGSAPPGRTPAEPQPRRAVPTTLFVWGPGRVLPVRLSSFNVEEVQYNPLLYVHRARVAIGLRVITSDELEAIRPQKAEHRLAAAAYKFTMKEKETLARINLANVVGSARGILPFV
jgi:hypothetical protein